MSAVHTSGLKVHYFNLKHSDDFSDGKDFMSFYFKSHMASSGFAAFYGAELMPIKSIEAKVNPIVTLEDLTAVSVTTYDATATGTGTTFTTPVEGMYVYFPEGMGMLSKQVFQVGKVTPQAGSVGPKFVLLGADTTGMTINYDPLGKSLAGGTSTLFLRDTGVTDLFDLCPTSIDFSTSAPGTTSIGTFCDPSLSISSDDGNYGTVTISGHLDSNISSVIGIMDQPASERSDYIYVAITLGALTETTGASNKKYLRGDQGSLLVTGNLVAYDLDVPLNGVLGYSFTIQLDAKPRHIF